MDSNAYINNMFNLSGHVGIITGASRGLGMGIASVLSKSGAKLYNFDIIPPTDKLEGIRHIKVDITDYQACEQAISEIIVQEGKLDFLINNAGITHKQRAEEFDQQRLEKILEINLQACFTLCQKAYPHLKESAYIGRIINISSMAAHLGFNGVVPYCMSKSGVLGLTRGLAADWSKDNILINSVAPGWVLTELNSKMFEDNPDRKEAARRKIPMGRFGTPEDIGKMILFLLSGAATYITGQDFQVDGGALGFGF